MESLLITAGGLGGADSPQQVQGRALAGVQGAPPPEALGIIPSTRPYNGLGSCISYANLVEMKTVKNSKSAPFGWGVVARIFLKKTAQMNKKHSNFSNYFSKF